MSKRGRKKKEKPVIKLPKEKINDINENDPHIYDPKDAYGSKLRK